MKARARTRIGGVMLAGLVGVLVLGLGSGAQALAPNPVGGSSGSLSDYLVGVPSSVLGQAETSPEEGALSAGTVTAGQGELSVPTSAAVGATRGLAGGGALLVAGEAWQNRADIATGLDSVIGVNANGSVCSGAASDGAWQPLIQDITGQDCSTTGDIPQAVQNADQPNSISGGQVCADLGVQGEVCASLVYTCDPYFALALDFPTANEGTMWVGVNQGSGTDITAKQGISPGVNDTTCTGASASPGVSYAGFSGLSSLKSYCILPSGNSNTCASPSSVVSVDAADPVRTLKCVVLTVSGGVYTASTAGFLESAGVLPAPVCPDLPKGDAVADTKYYETTPGQPDTLLEDLPSTSAYGNWAATAPSKCLSGGCTEDIETLTTPRVSCNEVPTAVVNGVSCADWFTDPNRATDFVCTYGGADVAFSECNTISQFYKPGSLTGGSLYADPATGDPVSTPSSPTPGAIAPGTPVQDPENVRQCFPTGWGVLNPVNWVLQPTTCALQWAFVPRASALQTDTQTLKTDFDDSPPGKVRDFAGTLVWPSGGTGCDGITLDFTQFKSLSASNGLGDLGGWNGMANVLNACPGSPLAPYATGVNVVLSAVIIFGGIMATLRLSGRLFGYSGPGSGQS